MNPMLSHLCGALLLAAAGAGADDRRTAPAPQAERVAAQASHRSHAAPAPRQSTLRRPATPEAPAVRWQADEPLARGMMRRARRHPGPVARRPRPPRGRPGEGDRR